MTHAEETQGLPSASGAERFYHCPGSITMEAQAPADVPSDEALQGDEIHQAMESEDFTALDDEGRTIAEQLKVQEEKAVAKWKQDAKETGKVSVHREERLWIKRSRTNPQPVASAKLDVLYIGDKSALVIDTKTGYLGVTPAYRNIQARIQALAVWHEFPRVHHVQAGISAYRFRGSWDPVDYYTPELVQSEQELMFNLWRAKQSYASRVPGKWCRYCKAVGFCPENAGMAMLPIVPFGDGKHKKAELLAKVETLDITQLAYIQERKSIIENVLEKVTARLKGFSAEELASVGLQLVPGGNVRTIPSVQAMWNLLFAESSVKFTIEEFQQCLKPVVTAIEEKLVEKLQARDGGTKKDALVKAKRLMDPAIELKPKAPTLKPLKGELPEGE